MNFGIRVKWSSRMVSKETGPTEVRYDFHENWRPTWNFMRLRTNYWKNGVVARDLLVIVSKLHKRVMCRLGTFGTGFGWNLFKRSGLNKITSSTSIRIHIEVYRTNSLKVNGVTPNSFSIYRNGPFRPGVRLAPWPVVPLHTEDKSLGLVRRGWADSVALSVTPCFVVGLARLLESTRFSYASMPRCVGVSLRARDPNEATGSHAPREIPCDRISFKLLLLCPTKKMVKMSYFAPFYTIPCKMNPWDLFVRSCADFIFRLEITRINEIYRRCV